MEQQDQSVATLSETCRTCGVALHGKFCAACGEKAFVPGEHSFKHFIGDVVNAITFLDTKFLRTIRLMITRPGAMSYQYVNGKRVPFFKPMSMFFVANLIYFLFPLYNSFDSSLKVQRDYQLYSGLATEMVNEKIKEEKVNLKTFEIAYNQQSTNMAKMVLFLVALYFSIPMALVNMGRKLYYYDHLMICLEFCSLLIIVGFVVVPWTEYFICWLVFLMGGDIWVIMNESVSSWFLGIMILYFLFRVEREAYQQSVFRSLTKATFLVAFFFGVLQVYRASLFFITFWTV